MGTHGHGQSCSKACNLSNGLQVLVNVLGCNMSGICGNYLPGFAVLPVWCCSCLLCLAEPCFAA